MWAEGNVVVWTGAGPENNSYVSVLFWIWKEKYPISKYTCKHLINDDSGLCISSMQKKMLFAGFTAVKKTIIQNWFTPHMCGKTYWIYSLLQIVTYECTTARINGAKPLTVDAWQCFLSDIRDYIKKWLLCSYCLSLFSSLLTGLWDIEYVSVVVLYFVCYVMYEKKNVDNKKMYTCKHSRLCLKSHILRWTHNARMLFFMLNLLKCSGFYLFYF